MFYGIFSIRSYLNSESLFRVRKKACEFRNQVKIPKQFREQLSYLGAQDNSRCSWKAKAKVKLLIG